MHLFTLILENKENNSLVIYIYPSKRRKYTRKYINQSIY